MSSIVIAGVVTNILSVVGIVITNKYITEVDGFHFMVFLSFLHFAFTTLGTRVMLWMGLFTYQPAPLSGILPVAAGSLLSVAFMNLNLSYNSVGFYQISKLACIPFTLIVQYVAYKLTVPRTVQLTLIPITFGVGYATVYDLSINPVGLAFATCAVVATALAQIFTNTYQKSLGCDALQLLYHTSPLITLGMLVMCAFFDDLHAFAHYSYQPDCVFRISLSCFFALGVNVSNYLVLGKTSPLTYQVLGHMKTVLILVLGFTVFNKPVDVRNVIGIVIAMVGVVAYTEVRRRDSTPGLPVAQSSDRLEK
ncbi:triose-phosphate transporter family-domain-containing protein [Ochromonadaceae sp. CCMP2298]|nr:triose-phosphate transporter family-domain-containing protein [Ochromonadaceae sp. CCMP2298]